ncbi:MAG: Fur family transcriptional regulator [Pseudomonadota bacterium]
MFGTALADKLAKHDVVPTPQRLEIAAILLDGPRHLSADQILDALRTNGSKVSKATVYNTLHLFGEKGLVREVHVDPTRTFFDSTTRPHHHFYNVDSGELSDIPRDAIAIQGVPELPHGTEQESVEVLIRVRNRPSTGD